MGKRYGQHFLRDPGIVARIVAGAAPEAHEPVLEIGPGQGVLTAPLLETGARVTAIEIDPALTERLRARFADEPRFRLIERDVLKADLAPEALFAPTPGQAAVERYAVIANLPYYLTTPLLFRLIAGRRHLSRLVLMVQREIAERLVALPAQGKAYGALSVAAHHAFTMRRLLRVPPGAFRPPPKVDSAVVHFVPRPSELPSEVEGRFLEYAKTMFSYRRKRMDGNLRRGFAEAWATHEAPLRAIVGDARPDALSPEQHLAVFRTLG